MYTSVIFDLDGTLLDTVSDLAEATNKALVDLGFLARSEENYNRYLGDGVYNLMIRVLNDQPAHLRPSKDRYETLVPELVSKQKFYYKDLWQNHTKPYKNIIPLIHALKASGAKIGVVSNKPHKFAVLMTEHFFKSGTFNTILGHKDNVPVKPAPDALFSAINTLNIDKDSLLYVGDTDTDMKTATNAGVASVGVTWGFRSEQELRENNAHFIVHDPMKILDLYLG